MTETSRTGRFKLRTSALRAYTMLLALVVIWLFFQWATIDQHNPYGIFLGAVNFSKLLQQMAVTGVLAVGMLMVIVSGNIDLSVGAVVGLAGGIGALTQGWGLVPCLASAILVGLLIGAVQGSLVAYVNIPAFIVTLGGLEAWRGVILRLTKGATIPVELPFFRSLGRDFLDPRIGIGLAIGGNPDAARLSGINLKRYILVAFCLMGALAGIASILHTARVGSASPDAGTLMELDAIASCVIGGTSLMGGRGTVFGAVLGA